MKLLNREVGRFAGLALLGALPYFAMSLLTDNVFVGFRFALVGLFCVTACVATLVLRIDDAMSSGAVALLSTLCSTTMFPLLISLVVWPLAIFLPEGRWLFGEPEAIFWMFAVLLPIGSVLAPLILIRIKKSLQSQQQSGIQV
jgi:hypothetical protein